jgi:hypothetical protein
MVEASAGLVDLMALYPQLAMAEHNSAATN